MRRIRSVPVLSPWIEFLKCVDSRRDLKDKLSATDQYSRTVRPLRPSITDQLMPLAHAESRLYSAAQHKAVITPAHYYNTKDDKLAGNQDL